MTPRFDIIGDIHGCADQLEELLTALRYEEGDGARHHEDRTAIFVGDFIDRGPQQKRTIEIVRPMIDEFGGAVLSDEQMPLLTAADERVASLAPDKLVFVGHY